MKLPGKRLQTPPKIVTAKPKAGSVSGTGHSAPAAVTTFRLDGRDWTGHAGPGLVEMGTENGPALFKSIGGGRWQLAAVAADEKTGNVVASSWSSGHQGGGAAGGGGGGGGNAAPAPHFQIGGHGGGFGGSDPHVTTPGGTAGFSIDPTDTYDAKTILGAGYPNMGWMTIPSMLVGGPSQIEPDMQAAIVSGEGGALRFQPDSQGYTGALNQAFGNIDAAFTGGSY